MATIKIDTLADTIDELLCEKTFDKLRNIAMKMQQVDTVADTTSWRYNK